MLVDIHSHLIPFIDDGASNIEESVKMLKHEEEIGVKKIILTPHFIYSRFDNYQEKIKENFDLLEKARIENNIDIELFLGQEICYTERVDIYKLLKEGKLLTLNNTNYILLEFHFHKEPTNLSEIIYNFKCDGYKVIIAHVERYKWFTYKKALEMKEEGCLIQLNSDSVIGKDGFKKKLLCNKLIKNGLVDYIASDTHEFRPSTLDLAYKKTNDQKYFDGHNLIK